MIDFTPYFKKYEELIGRADAVFAKVKAEYPDCVKCHIGCSDCCFALFDLHLIEALYINYHLHRNFSGEEIERIIELANRADRMIYQIKREVYRQISQGGKEAEILTRVATERIRCPLLNEDNKCDLYEYRPITCRFYGIPTAIAGRGHTCGMSEFVEGKQYPTVNLDIIHSKLYEIGDELAKAIGSKYTKLNEMLVPLSMAIITTYDEEYLGIDPDKKD